ncbi:phosphatidylserine decarboxylase 1 [Massospora cicadina]|nr:phosphatidylserine decarboxylase 1 [Massospora cicadina]
MALSRRRSNLPTLSTLIISMVHLLKFPLALIARVGRNRREFVNSVAKADIYPSNLPYPPPNLPYSRTGFYLRHRFTTYCGYGKPLDQSENPRWETFAAKYFHTEPPFHPLPNAHPRSKGFEQKPYKEEGAENLFSRVRRSWRKAPLKWAPIPLGLGLSYLAFLQLWPQTPKTDEEGKPTPGKRRGPWQLQIYTSLPLRSLSRLFGYFNEFNLPVWVRGPGLKLYAWMFGCNLDEMLDPDLTHYPNLAAFFYRQIRPDARPIANALLVSPADGRVLHFGVVEGSQIEQIKGITYDLHDLFGRVAAAPPFSQAAKPASYAHAVVDEAEFANVNGIPYSLGGMFNGEAASSPHPKDDADAACEPPAPTRGWENLAPGHQLYFCVVYLAPGDYHRFHSPTNWVVTSRRHFAGELYSVSPFVLRYLENLFVLNERVALEGRWRHGFFAMLPVGATNVGSIKIHFDEDLRTNARRVTHRGAYTQVTYDKASPLLGGYPLTAGQEMGGFCLGSTVVLVFSAPAGFEFRVRAGQKVQVGQPLGDLPRPGSS